MPHPYASGMVVTEDDDQGWREFRQPVAPTEGRPAEGVSDSAALVAQFLGPLIAYDARRATELTATLAEFLEQGGNLEAAASTLGIHRSTLRYRWKGSVSLPRWISARPRRGWPCCRPPGRGVLVSAVSGRLRPVNRAVEADGLAFSG